MTDDESTFENRVADVLGRRVESFVELESLERLSGGASQETYRIVVRVANGGGAEGPRRRLVLRRATGGVDSPAFPGPGLAVEALLMRVAGDAGVPVPRVLEVLDPADGLGPAFLMEWVDGEALGAKIARSPELRPAREHLAFQCGEILARIHAVDVEATGLRAQLTTVSAEEYVRKTWDEYRELPAAEPMIDYTARWLLEHLPPVVEPRLVHNDFRNGNFIVGPDGIAAVLDWELAHLGDPMRDLGWLCTSSWRFGVHELDVGGFGKRDDLFRGYQSVSGSPVDADHVRFWEVFGSFWWATVCLHMAYIHRSGQDRSVERAAIGRRCSEALIDCVNLLIPGPVELVEAERADADPELPAADELLESVRDHLKAVVSARAEGRDAFLARVAAGSVDVVRRELRLGPALRDREQARLRELYASTEDRAALRARLVRELRDGTLSIGAATPPHDVLTTYLRDSVANRVAIDQPKYSGLRHALGRTPT